jgi:hypothetical protein
MPLIGESYSHEGRGRTILAGSDGNRHGHSREDAFAAVLEGILRALTELMTTAGSIKIQLTELCKINHPLAH